MGASYYTHGCRTGRVSDLVDTALHAEKPAERIKALKLLIASGNAGRDLLLSLADDPDPGMVETAAAALVRGRPAHYVLGVFDEVDGYARDLVALRLLERAPAQAIEPVIAALGPVPEEPRVARALAAAIVDADDARGQAALVELVAARFASASALSPAGRDALFEKASEASEGRRMNLLELLLHADRWRSPRPLRQTIADGLREDLGTTPRWHLVWAALLLNREDLVGPGKDAVSYALYYALDHRPRFHPPPARWEDDHKRMSVRFALERPELHSDVLGYLRKVEFELPDADDESGATPWHLCAVLDHLGRPMNVHAGSARLLREQPQAIANAAIDHVGLAFADPARFGGDLEARYADLRVKSRKRIIGWSRKRGA
jgi:hypothetical protein